MAKYKVGDRVRIVSQKPNHPGFMADMEQYLGKTLTVRSVAEGGTFTHYTQYTFDEACAIPSSRCYWFFLEAWIAGLAKPKQKKESGLRVVIRFEGDVTTARMIRGGTVVKTATARCSPKDQYSHAEGARVAMERLFAKKEEQP